MIRGGSCASGETAVPEALMAARDLLHGSKSWLQKEKHRGHTEKREQD
jgi:hypothetical protein